MSSPRVETVLRAALQRLHPPAELVEHTRWLFCLASIASVGLTSLTVLSGDVTGWSFALATVAAVTFVVSWLHRYRRRRAPLPADLADLLALALFAAACPRPVLALGVAFPAVWYRAVYGDTRRIVAYGLGVCLALTCGLQLWSAVPGHGAQLAAAAVLGNLPVLLLTVFVVRHLAVGLFEREHTRARDTALAALGGQLLGVTDRSAILRTAWATAEAVCAATPGLRTAVLARDGDVLRVHGAAGEFLRRPTTLPGDLLSDEDPDPQRVVPPTALVLSSGVRGEWLGLPMPDSPGGYMLLGGHPTVPGDAVLAVQSMLNQVALALRTSSAHRELRAQALTDRLTGLANRTAFSAAVDAALADADSEAWVLFLDLDDFKVVNDTLGHLAGDRLLAHLGCELTGALRAEDLCARLGGDEFAVLLRGAGEAEARRIGQRIVETISTPVELGEGLARIGASIGATRLQPGSTETLVVHQADVAMYAAKSAGKNRVHFFHPGMLQLEAAAEAEAELRAAVDGGELVLAYQPVVAAGDGRCTAVEALVRWAHPERGLLGPDQFLALAEETGAIVPLGEFVVRRVCADAARWAQEGHPVAVHVNASPTQLAHPRFVELVRESLATTGLAPGRLVVEVTETTVLDSPVVAATLDALVALGVGIALDDFGTGYSALTTLRSLPIGIVKIDRSFVAGVLTQAADQAVVEAIVQMASRLGLQTVAEGVESVEQQDVLERAGIDSLQGYLYLPPAPAAEFTAWLADNRRRSSTGELTPA
ncbi:EAL domain-containing protein [Modestobacter sp. VKM Ac-2986]|uniref:putative bifunctional diguanylate cyclase/phosphodiesterase n=1 Tax=Modestobacter sp. VKM Ac-2986 TaxID=3004140 RepID=UPI0022AA967D|nr:EAL domain-containing protein [Modestobacter sp. VKM Ac-2986]MCZ2828091.1 EAL domain-containing protein [Modestobacter sp. VKM Ac-2986]